MKKEALNIGPYADDAVVALKNILLNKPSIPPQQDPNNKPAPANNMLLLNKTADEHFNSMAHLFDHSDNGSSTEAKKAKKDKAPVDLDWRKKMKAMHKPVELTPAGPIKQKDILKPSESFHKEVVKNMKDNPHGMFKPRAIGSSLFKHISNHKFPYAAGAVGIGAVGAKVLFDHLNKEDTKS